MVQKVLQIAWVFDDDSRTDLRIGFVIEGIAISPVDSIIHGTITRVVVLSTKEGDVVRTTYSMTVKTFP